MTQPIQPIVRTTGVNHFFGVGDTRTQVLFDNNLEVMPGELVIMSGPSGSGKTTLLTLIGGLRTLQEGNIDIWDSALNQHRSLIGLNELGLVQVRRLIGFIFQRHNLFESLNAMQNVRMAQQLRDLAPNSDELASNLLKELGLGERVGYKPYQLSGGQRQRVAIARALINKPKLILADEPTAALDEKSGEAVVRLLKTLAKENGTTSLIVTHDSRIMNEADRIVEMQRGHIHVNIVVAERLFIYEGLRRCAAFVSLLPNEQFAIADKISIGLHPRNAATNEHIRKHPWLEVYEPGQPVIRQGDRGDKFYLIRQGEVDVVVNDATGQRNVAHLGTGDFFGDRALVVDQPRNATVVAATRLEVYTISREEFQKASRTTLPFIQRIVEVYSGGPPIIVPGSRPDIELPPKSSL